MYTCGFWLLFVLKFMDATSHVCHDSPNTPVEWYFHSLPDCPEDYLYWAQSETRVNSIMACARRCAEDDKCLSFYVRTSSDQLLCGVIQTPVTSCSELSYLYSAKFYLKSNSACLYPWRLALHQSAEYVISGSLTYLLEMVERGSQVRILIFKEAAVTTFDTTNIGTFYDVDSIWVSNTTVTAQMFTWTLEEGSREVLWTKVQANSLGRVVETYYKNRVDESEADLLWFVKETELKCGLESSTVLEMLPNGNIVQGSFDDLETVMEEGFHIQVVERRSDNKVRSFKVSRVSLGSDDSFQFSGVWLGASPDSPNNNVFTNEMVTIVTQPTLAFSILSDIDIMNITHYGMRQDINASILLAADFCWEKLLVTVGYRQVLFGSFSKLRETVDSGSDIRVVYRCNNVLSTQAMSIDHVVVSSTGLIAYSVQSLSNTTGESFNWEWVEVHENGTVVEVTYSHANYHVRISRTSCQARISWFANTRERVTAWFFHEENSYNSEYYGDFPRDRLAEGWIPKITSQSAQGNGRWGSFRSHTVTVFEKIDESYTVLAVNYGYFNGSHWNIFFHDSRHFQMLVGINTYSIPSSVGNISSVTPFWMAWHF